jgi:hypothetical protein
MLEFIFYLLFIYVIYKSLQFFIRYINSSSKSRTNVKGKDTSKSKFEDVEEAEFREIDKSEDKKTKNN